MGQKLSGIVSQIDGLFCDQKTVGDILVGERLSQAFQRLAWYDTKDFNDDLIADFPVGKRNTLVQKSECVTHTAIGVTGDQGQSLVADRKPFSIRYLLELAHDLGRT